MGWPYNDEPFVVRVDRGSLLRFFAIPLTGLALSSLLCLAFAVYALAVLVSRDPYFGAGVAGFMVLITGAQTLFATRLWRTRARIAVPLIVDRAGLRLATRFLPGPVFLPWEIVAAVKTRGVAAGSVFTFVLRPGVTAHHPGTQGFDERAIRIASTRDGLYLDTRWLTADPASIARAIAALSGGRVPVNHH